MFQHIVAKDLDDDISSWWRWKLGVKVRSWCLSWVVHFTTSPPPPSWLLPSPRCFHMTDPFFVSLLSLSQTSGLFPTWRWLVTAPTSAPNLAIPTPAGCLVSLHPTADLPRVPPSCPPLCLTRRWTSRSSWLPMAAPSPWQQRSAGQEAAVAVPKWLACGSWRPTAVPTLAAETRLAKTVVWRRSPWTRGWSIPLETLRPARLPRGRSTCEGTALHLNAPPTLHSSSLTFPGCCSPLLAPHPPTLLTPVLSTCSTAPTALPFYTCTYFSRL